ncbi:hypothetical protein GCM10010293_64770 [Streptomyces griseoflavus]|nr:hypothetical protein GCM10010293_64770 [Streptomyces griseoflavus]
MSFRNQRRARGTDSGVGSRSIDPSLGAPSQGCRSITKAIGTLSLLLGGATADRMERPLAQTEAPRDLSRHPDHPEICLEMSIETPEVRRNVGAHGYTQRAHAGPMA